MVRIRGADSRFVQTTSGSEGAGIGATWGRARGRGGQWLRGILASWARRERGGREPRARRPSWPVRAAMQEGPWAWRGDRRRGGAAQPSSGPERPPVTPTVMAERGV
jgi:hypothetical protein